jgi:hypothetical protein
MEEIINLVVEVCHRISFGSFFNKRKPFPKYVRMAKTANVEEGRLLIGSLREKDWMNPVDGKEPSYILFKGHGSFSPYVLDVDYKYIQRLYKIEKPEILKNDDIVLVKVV